jgi:hypothetical protein
VDASAPEADTPGDSPTKAPAETADAAEPAAAAAPASHEPEVTKRLSVVRSRAGTRSATRAPTAKLCAQCIRLLVCAIAVGLLWVTMLAYAKDIVFYFVQRPDGVRARCATDVPLWPRPQHHVIDTWGITYEVGKVEDNGHRACARQLVRVERCRPMRAQLSGDRSAGQASVCQQRLDASVALSHQVVADLKTCAPPLRA